MKGRPSGERGAHLLPFAAEDGHRTAAPPQRLLGITHARKTPKNSCAIDCTVKRIQAPSAGADVVTLHKHYRGTPYKEKRGSRDGRGSGRGAAPAAGGRGRYTLRARVASPLARSSGGGGEGFLRGRSACACCACACASWKSSSERVIGSVDAPPRLCNGCLPPPPPPPPPLPRPSRPCAASGRGHRSHSRDPAPALRAT
mmetsp:Transcript_45101/g.146823  ORF Transcript_45101/g.146823 Transcript_45101/m.146823 type:complete len:200 (-) Transcript_45101:560-1159(-)